MLLVSFSTPNSLGDPNGLSSEHLQYAVVPKQTNKKRDISENSGGTFCMSGTIYFIQKYTVLPKQKWSLKSTFQIFGSPKNKMVNENNFSKYTVLPKIKY